MDELDSLLEELANSSSQNAAGPEGATGNVETPRKHGQVLPAYTSLLPDKKVQESDSSHVNSQLSAPAEAPLLSPNSASRELESIMQELLGLGLELSGPPAPSAQPPHVAKSGKDKDKEQIRENGQAREGETVARRNSDQAPDKAPQPDKAAASIDDLLGGLSSDMEKMGVRTVAKGNCASCGKCIVGKMITALGETWHPEHFVCVVCRTELGTTGFFEREGKAFCEKDYQDLFAPRCAYCMGPILQNILTAMDRSWHPEHFFCSECGELFGPEGFLERDGKPYCNRDFYQLFAPKCSGCGEPVRENYLSAANGTWHPECFVCADCRSPFLDGCFMELEGLPLCPLHFHTRQGTLCGGCGAPIAGRCISALERKFHPEHFVCAFCLRQLNQGVFKEQGGKPYCAACHDKLFL